jgi:hypothetical protein
LIGHDYSVGRYAQNAVVGNAVFMNSATPRIVMLTTWAPSANVTNTLQAIQQVAQGIRLYTLQTHRNYTTLPALLSVDRFDVVVVLAQTAATDDELGAAARILGPSISSFVRAGGVAVVLDGEGANAGTWQLATASGLINIDGRSVVTGETLAVENGTDALGIGLPLEYRAERSSVSFRGASAGMVVSARSGAVVIHRGYSPRR